MKTHIRERIIRKLMASAPVAWPAILARFQRRHKFTPTDMDDLRGALDDQAERCAFLSEYISVRFGCTGCGDKTPDVAVKYAQKRQKKVTAALGFYTKYRTPFFSSGTMPKE